MARGGHNTLMANAVNGLLGPAFDLSREIVSVPDLTGSYSVRYVRKTLTSISLKPRADGEAGENRGKKRPPCFMADPQSG